MATENQPNYQHLLYFWMVAREGSLNAAAKALGVTSPTISVQLRQLEAELGLELLRRRGRCLELTEIGETVYRYAQRIFSTGRELVNYASGQVFGGPLRLDVGVAHVLPKTVAWRLLEPALMMEEECRISCRAERTEELISELLLHQIDVVLTDGPLGGSGVGLFNHRLGTSPMVLVAPLKMAEALASDFPASLDGVPMLVPSVGSATGLALEHWLKDRDLQPLVNAVFDDSALMKVAAGRGFGVTAVPRLVVDEVRKMHGLKTIGEVDGVAWSFYLVSAEREFAHPAVEAIKAKAEACLLQTPVPRATVEPAKNAAVETA